MIKRWLTVAAALALLGAAAVRAADRQGTFEILYGNYRVNESLFDMLYGRSGALYGAALTATLFSHFDFYLEAKIFSKQGRLSYTQEKTRFLLVPFSLGLRYRLPLGLVEPFLGAGIDYYIYSESNPIGTVVDHARGSHLLAGLSLRPGANSPVALTGRLKWTTAKASHGGRTIDLGGLELGAGLTFIF